MPTMRCIYGALGCVAWVLFVLFVRGPDDWSDTLGFTFYGSLVLGPVLGIAGGVMAILDRRLEMWKRVVAIGVGIVLPIASVTLVTLIFLALSQLE